MYIYLKCFIKIRKVHLKLQVKFKTCSLEIQIVKLNCKTLEFQMKLSLSLDSLELREL